MAFQENPFVFGEIIDDANFVNRIDELNQLVRDLADGQKVSYYLRGVSEKVPSLLWRFSN
jgi:hypothetical protein